jgi:hypothetical protein
MVNTINEDLTLVGPHSVAAVASVGLEPKPVIESFLEVIEKILSEHENMRERPWIVNYLSGETINYGEIVPRLMR